MRYEKMHHKSLNPTRKTTKAEGCTNLILLVKVVKVKET